MGPYGAQSGRYSVAVKWLTQLYQHHYTWVSVWTAGDSFLGPNPVGGCGSVVPQGAGSCRLPHPISLKAMQEFLGMENFIIVSSLMFPPPAVSLLGLLGRPEIICPGQHGAPDTPCAPGSYCSGNRCVRHGPVAIAQASFRWCMAASHICFSCKLCDYAPFPVAAWGMLFHCLHQP